MRYYCLATALVLLVSATGAPAQTSEQISLMLGHTEIKRLPSPATYLFIADPTIADLTRPNPEAREPISVVVLTAKGFGTTNFIALDENNREVYRAVINVGRSVTVAAAGSVIHSYVCNPNCSPGTGNKEATLSSLPPGSSVTTPVGGGKPGP
jgi:Flp pilus assembly secretin CpaC